MTAATAAPRPWPHLAACRGEDPELFFAEGDPRTEAVIAQTAEAKSICARCPVTADCLAHALATRQQHGTWGGKSEEELRALAAAADPGVPSSCQSGRHVITAATRRPAGGCRDCDRDNARARARARRAAA